MSGVSQTFTIFTVLLKGKLSINSNVDLNYIHYNITVETKPVINYYAKTNETQVKIN